MEKLITIYHGSPDTIEHPYFGGGRKNNDYGIGFYCTKSEELAKEWAVSSLHDGFANRYTLDTEFLKILNLNSSDYTILNWIAVLLEHRVFPIKNPIARKAKEYLIRNFGINVNAYDVITGYRADDSYFDFAEGFINNGMTVTQLAAVMRLGELGEQIVLKSQFSFSRLKFVGAEYAEKSIYFERRKQRDDKVNAQYLSMLENDELDDGLLIRDIMKGGITNEDARIPRNIP